MFRSATCLSHFPAPVAFWLRGSQRQKMLVEGIRECEGKVAYAWQIDPIKHDFIPNATPPWVEGWKEVVFQTPVTSHHASKYIDFANRDDYILSMNLPLIPDFLHAVLYCFFIPALLMSAEFSVYSAS